MGEGGVKNDKNVPREATLVTAQKTSVQRSQFGTTVIYCWEGRVKSPSMKLKSRFEKI
jgi:hypothetical protein